MSSERALILDFRILERLSMVINIRLNKGVKKPFKATFRESAVTNSKYALK
jgi:hypothetical protein